MVTTPTMDLQGIIHYDTLQKQLVNVLSEAKDDMIPMAELFKIFVSVLPLGKGSPPITNTVGGIHTGFYDKAAEKVDESILCACH